MEWERDANLYGEEDSYWIKWDGNTRKGRVTVLAAGFKETVWCLASRTQPAVIWATLTLVSDGTDPNLGITTDSFVTWAFGTEPGT